MKDLELFSTSELGNAGVKIPLTDVEGNKTEHWIKIVSIDSTQFKKAQSLFRKAMLDTHADEEPDEALFNDPEKADRLTTELLASLVVAWSFKNDDGTPYECSKANVIKVLRDAPVLAQEIDEASAQRRNFIKRSSTKSATSRSKSSSSRNIRKTQKSVS